MDNGNKYRLQKINDIQQNLKDERLERSNLSKRYHRAITVIGGVDTALSGIIIALGSTVVFFTFNSFHYCTSLDCIGSCCRGNRVHSYNWESDQQNIIAESRKT